jgi:regulatory protein
LDLRRPTPLDRALRLLGARARTEQELRLALARAGYSEGECESAVARVRELGYLNDAEVARTRAKALLGRGAAAGFSRRRLEEQGIRAADAAAAVDEASEGVSEEERVRRALDGRLRGRAVRDEAERQRIFRALVRKGHRPSAVARVLGVEWEGDEQDAV